MFLIDLVWVIDFEINKWENYDNRKKFYTEIKCAYSLKSLKNFLSKVHSFINFK